MRRPRSLPSQYRGGPSRRPTLLCSDAAVRAQTPGSGTFDDTNPASTQWRFPPRRPSFCLAAVWKTKTASISHNDPCRRRNRHSDGSALQGDRWVFCSLKIDASAIGSSGRRTYRERNQAKKVRILGLKICDIQVQATNNWLISPGSMKSVPDWCSMYSKARPEGVFVIVLVQSIPMTE